MADDRLFLSIIYELSFLGIDSEVVTLYFSMVYLSLTQSKTHTTRLIFVQYGGGEDVHGYFKSNS